MAAGIIRRDGKILITRRPAGTHLEGMWEFPGGKLESGESPEACLEREIMEELGLEIKVGKHLLTVEHEYDIKRVTLNFFECLCKDNIPKPLEGQEMEWAEKRDLNRYSFPPPDREIINLLNKLF